MTAAAAAARASDGLPSYWALVMVVAGGLVEGTALGVLQGAWLARRYPGLSRSGWMLATVLVAGVGWALAAAPSTLNENSGAEPDPVFILVMAAGLGLGMGALLGVAQALVMRLHVRHPWRWVSISAAAWTPTMVIIFAGATVPDASWPTATVILWGALTGVLAGAGLGVVSIVLMPTLTGQSMSSRALARSLRLGVPGLAGTFALLRVRGAKSGRGFEFPVQYARSHDLLVVFAGDARRKNWWRNLRLPAALSVWIDGAWKEATGHAITAADAGYSEAQGVYSRRWPRVRMDEHGVLVRIRLNEPAHAGAEPSG